MGKKKQTKRAGHEVKSGGRPAGRVPKAGAGKKKTPASGSQRVSRTGGTGTGRKAGVARSKGAPSARRAGARKSPAFRKEPSFSKALQEEISTVLVTGASGCVGSFLVHHLLRAGYAVIAAVGEGAQARAPAGKNGLAVKQGKLADPGFAESCLEGVDAVFHAGGLADGRPLYGDPEPLPVDATRTLYRLSRERGVKRFILITSAAVYGRCHGPVSEEAPLEARDEYEQIQSEMEDIVLEDALPGLPAATVLRPASVYGPGCTGAMASLATLPPLVKTLGPYYIPVSGGPRTSLVHGDDVARAAIFLLLQPGAYGSAFNVAGNDPLPFGRFLNEAMEAYGLKPLGQGVPYPPSTLLRSILPYNRAEEIFNPLGKISNLLWERIVRAHRLEKALLPGKGKLPPPFGTGDLVVDNGKLLGMGFRLKYPRFRRGWDKTLAWYLKHRWIPRPEDL